MALNFDTKTSSFYDIMGNGRKYIVPRFQRDYSWEEEQWEDLWQDSVELTDDTEQHYMGYLLLQTNDLNREYTIIDGQQRITTITIIILAALNKLSQFIEEGNEEEENKIRLNKLKEIYIGFTDTVTLTTKPKLTLNYNNDKYFRNYLCEFKKPPIRGIKSSEKLLSKAQSFFIDKMNSKNFTNGKQIADFIEKLVDKLIFTTITVGSDLNAYKVFETLNARGVKLSTPDLIKNYLFSVIDEKQPLHAEEIRGLEEKWGSITEQLGKDGDFSRFVHIEWNSRNTPFTQKTALFKAIKHNIVKREDAFPYLDKLQISSEVYAALSNPGDEFWNREIYKKARNPLQALEYFKIIQPHGLLISAYHHFDGKDFIKIIKYIEAVSVRYNIIGRLQPNAQERVYNEIACDIYHRKLTNLSGIKNRLKDIYPGDDDFFNDFIHKHMKTTQSPKKMRYILARIEETLKINPSVDDNILTLEHILPRNPDQNWESNFSNDEIEESVELIGNMTLLQKDINKDIKNKSYPEKRKIYQESPYLITKKCAEYQKWNKDAILERQKWLAEQAVKCWRIEFD